MGDSIVSLEGEFAQEEAQGWEGRVFRHVCEQGQREAAEYLEALDEALFEQRPSGWEVVGFRERTVVTRFGEVRIRRRLYQDGRGRYHLLLDEYVGLKAHQAATPEMQALCTILGSEMSFRTAADVLERWQVGLLSSSSCWRLLQRTGEAAASAEAAAAQAVFERGERLPEAGERKVERLYMEADGVFVRLQRQPQSHIEVRSAIAYEGWERLAGAREAYRLRGKRVYCHANEQVPFWEGASLAERVGFEQVAKRSREPFGTWTTSIWRGPVAGHTAPKSVRSCTGRCERAQQPQRKRGSKMPPCVKASKRNATPGG